MKVKILIIILLSGLLFPMIAFSAGEWDISDEPRQSVNKAKQGFVTISPATNTVVIFVPRGYMDGGNFIKTDEVRIIWQGTKYTEFMTHFDKQAIKAMIQAEL